MFGSYVVGVNKYAGTCWLPTWVLECDPLINRKKGSGGEVGKKRETGTEDSRESKAAQ